MRIRNICRELKNKMGQTGPDRLITGNTGFPLKNGCDLQYLVL